MYRLCASPDPAPEGVLKRAFTLIELLVVVAALIMLTALAVPWYRKSVAAAQRAACAAHLKAWGAAFALYASEHKGLLPHPDDRRRDGGAYGSLSHPEHDQGYIDVLPPYMGDRPWRDIPNGNKPRSGFWQCPAARPRPDSEYDYRPSYHGYHSYAMNSYLAHDFYFGLPWSAELQPSFLFLPRAVNPSLTILMFEQTLDPDQGYGQAGSLRSAGYQTAEDARAVSERHQNSEGHLGGNVLYLDGHVGWRDDLWDETTRNPRIPRRGDLTWFPYYY